jgi:hypothetical protein
MQTEYDESSNCFTLNKAARMSITAASVGEQYAGRTQVAYVSHELERQEERYTPFWV